MYVTVCKGGSGGLESLRGSRESQHKSTSELIVEPPENSTNEPELVVEPPETAPTNRNSSLNRLTQHHHVG
jgi:hypothetical protein